MVRQVGYPECKYIKQNYIGVKCPDCKDGDIAEKKARRGNIFYGCSNYPNCDFVVWDKPVAETCPECGYIGAESKFTKARGEYRRCIKCANEWDVVPSPEAVAV